MLSCLQSPSIITNPGGLHDLFGSREWGKGTTPLDENVIATLPYAIAIKETSGGDSIEREKNTIPTYKIHYQQPKYPGGCEQTSH